MFGYTQREEIVLRRNCEALQVPSGAKVELKEGSRVVITQALGGSFTVLTEDGNMARIAAENADALGKERQAEVKLPEGQVTREAVEAAVTEQLKTCYDPEIPVNIVDLGLVYESRLDPVPGAEGQFDVFVKMTLTAPGCGMGGVLQAEAESKIKRIPGVREVKVEIVFDPPWDRAMMSEAARLQLGLY